MNVEMTPDAFVQERERKGPILKREGEKSQDGYEGMLLKEETEEWSRRETSCVYCIQMPISHSALQMYGKCSSKEISLLTKQQVHSSAERKLFYNRDIRLF